VEHREACLRLCRDGLDGKKCNNVEVKVFDGTGNAYLYLGALLTSGMLRLKKEEGCQFPELLTTSDPGSIKCPKLPDDLAAALELFKNDKELYEALPFASTFIDVKTKELETKSMKELLSIMLERF
jgi:glutamine synthetase